MDSYEGDSSEVINDLRKEVMQCGCDQAYRHAHE